MKLIFNLHTLIQAIIILPVIFIITYFIPSNFLKDWIPYGDTETIVLFLVASLIATILDVFGIKGKLFYIPTWILLFIFPFFAFQANNIIFKILSLSFILILIVFHTLKTRKMLRKEWKDKKDLMDKLKNNLTKINEQEFWKYASNIYFKPSLLFLYFYPIWKIIYDNAIDKNEFTDYYKYFVNSINLENFNSYSNKQNFFFKNEIKKLNEDLNDSNNFVSLKHRPFSLHRLGLAIDFKNKTFANN